MSKIPQKHGHSHPSAHSTKAASQFAAHKGSGKMMPPADLMTPTPATMPAPPAAMVGGPQGLKRGGKVGC